MRGWQQPPSSPTRTKVAPLLASRPGASMAGERRGRAPCTTRRAIPHEPAQGGSPVQRGCRAACRRVAPSWRGDQRIGGGQHGRRPP